MKSLISLLVFVAFLAVSPGIFAQQSRNPLIPPDVQKIFDKLRRGEELTEAEEERMEKWSEEMEKKVGELEKTPARPGKLGTKSDSPFSADDGSPCPKPKLIKSLPKSAPTAEAYVALVKGLAAKYATQAGEIKTKLDSALTKAPEIKANDVGAVLLAAEAGSAAAYVTARAIVKEPTNFLAANNLGVILTGMEDPSSALAVLFYADRLRPNVPLVQLNLGWVYYDLGDRVNAKRYFQKAAKLSPELSGAHNGLGLVAQCEGNYLEAIVHFRDALQNGFSVVGAAAYKAAQQQAAESGKQDGDSSKPIADEKEQGGDFKVPQPPITEKRAQTQAAKPHLERMTTRITNRLDAVRQQLVEVSDRIRRQNERAMQDPDAIVLNRTFDKQLFLFSDMAEMLLGERSELGRALKTTRQEMQTAGQAALDALPDLQRDMEKQMELMKRMEGLFKEMEGCGDFEPCKKAVEKKMTALRYEMDQLAYQSCLRQKDMLETAYVHQYKGWKAYHDQLTRALQDYHAFSGPVIEEVYAPALNEYLNLFREGMILTHEQIDLGMGANLPDLVGNIQELDCQPPEPPQPAPSEDGGDPKKKEPDCPFKKPLTIKLIVVSMELDCSYVKIEGGEGLVASYKRDFKKKETTIGIGVGAGLDSELGGIEGKMMIEITGNGNTVSDVAFTSTVSSKLGGEYTGASIEGELGGRISLESGPSVTFDTKAGWSPNKWGMSLPGN